MTTHTPHTPRRPRELDRLGRLALVAVLSLPLLTAVVACLVVAGCSGPEAPPARSRAVVAPTAPTRSDGGAAAPATTCPRGEVAARPIPLPRGSRLHQTHALPGGITLRIHRAPYGDVVTLHRGATLLHSQDGYRYEVAHLKMGNKRVPLAGLDINGDRAPELVLREWSGGAHCCSTFTVFRLTPCLKRLATLEGGHGGRFADLDRDGTLEYIAPDPAVHHWGHFYIWQMAPEIVYAWRPAIKGHPAGYRASARHMARPAPKKPVLRRWTREIARGRRGGANCCRELWIFEDLLTLLYSGHEQLAWKHLDRAWPKAYFPKRAVIKSRLQRMLKRSRAWRELSRQWQQQRAAQRTRRRNHRKAPS